MLVSQLVEPFSFLSHLNGCGVRFDQKLTYKCSSCIKLAYGLCTVDTVYRYTVHSVYVRI